MIEFNGQISEKVQLDITNRRSKFETILFLVTPIVLAIVSLPIVLAFNLFEKIWLEFLICLLTCWGVAIFIRKTPKQVLLRFRIAPHIIITNEELSLEFWNGGKKVRRTRKLSKVKKVLDCGDVYYIILKFGDITGSWICQKDNMVKGTIEEFENIFQSKIVRKLK